MIDLTFESISYKIIKILSIFRFILIYMPITQSAKKALRQSKKRYLANQKKKAELKTAIKIFKKLVLADKPKEAQKQLRTVYKKLDKAAKTHLIKKNKSSRLKSRLTLLLNKKSKNA